MSLKYTFALFTIKSKSKLSMCMKHKFLSHKQKYTHVEIEIYLLQSYHKAYQTYHRKDFSQKIKLTGVIPWKQVIFQDQDLLVNTIRIDDMNRALLIAVILLE